MTTRKFTYDELVLAVAALKLELDELRQELAELRHQSPPAEPITVNLNKDVDVHVEVGPPALDFQEMNDDLAARHGAYDESTGWKTRTRTWPQYL